MKYKLLILSAILIFSLQADPVKKHRPVLEVNFAEKVPFSTDFSITFSLSCRENTVRTDFSISSPIAKKERKTPLLFLFYNDF